jgi:tetrahydromethanopterin S-methyltransferase subunit D
MSALGGKAAGGDGINMTGTIVGIVIILISLAATFMISSSLIIPLVGIIVGGALIGFGVHFVPVGGAPAAMGQAPGIATGVAMLAAGAGLAGLFGGAWAYASPEGTFLTALLGGAVGGGLMMAITCMMVNATYVFAMGIPAASGKVAKDPITGDTFPEYKSQGTEGHGLPFISFFGGVIGGTIAGLGGTLIYIMLLNVYQTGLPTVPGVTNLAGIFAIGFFLVNAVLAAYNITGTIEGPHDPKFKRVPRAIIGCAVASAFCGLISMMLVMGV